MRLVVMGVEASGKSSVGREVAALTGWPFLDGDDFHTPEARRKMAGGRALTDADRAPWLTRLRAELGERADVVLACSALRRVYRDTLRMPGTRFLFLNVPESLLRQRVAARTGHYAGPDLLPSQLATLEAPGPGEGDALTLDVTAADTSAGLARRALHDLGVPEARRPFGGGRKPGERPSKVCAACGLPFTWRRKWERDWENVRYCSDRCRAAAKRGTP